MKLLSTLLLCCLAILGFGQITASKPALANPLPIGTVIADGNNFAVKTATGTTPIYFNGTSVSGDALNWGTAAEFADKVLGEGINLVRFHHESATIARLAELADACYARGIYFCFDVVGDRWMNRKVHVYEDDQTKNALGQTIRGELVVEMDRLKPLLRHPGLAYAALVNEGATPLLGKYISDFARCVEICNETYGWFKARLAERGFTGLVGDLPDANIDPARFGPIVAKQDLLLVHGYGTHNNGQNAKWPEQWAIVYGHGNSIVNHINNYGRWVEAVIAPPPSFEPWRVERVPAPKPVLIQEFACMYPNPDRGMNELLWRIDFLRRGYSVCSYAMATNKAQMRPLGDPLGSYTEIHDFAWITDPARRNAQAAGAFLVKYGQGPITDWYYAGSLWPGPFADPNVRYAAGKVTVKLDALRGFMQIKAGYKKLYYVSIDQTLVRGFTWVDAGNGWRKTTKRGSIDDIGTWIPKPIDVGAPVSGAYQWDMETKRPSVTLKKKGNLVYPVGAGVIEVNLQ